LMQAINLANTLASDPPSTQMNPISSKVYAIECNLSKSQLFIFILAKTASIQFQANVPKYRMITKTLQITKLIEKKNISVSMPM
jgi:hypothetical protein